MYKSIDTKSVFLPKAKPYPFLDVLVHALGGELRTATITGPRGDPVEGSFGYIPNHDLAIIEMALASGLKLLPKDKRKPIETTTYGTGELIAAALNSGVFKVGLLTEKSRLQRTLLRLCERMRWLRRLSVWEQVVNLNRVLRGHYGYHGIAGNASRRLWVYCEHRINGSTSNLFCLM